MFKKIENTPRNIFGMKMSGKVAKEDYKEMDDLMEDYKKYFEHLNLLMIIEDFEWTDFEAFWADLKMDLKYFKDVEKAAVLTSEKWIENTAKTIQALTPNMDMKTFTTSEEAKAIEWLQQ